MAGAFQPNAFQNNAFQVSPSVLTVNISEGIRASEELALFLGTGLATSLQERVSTSDVIVVALNPERASATEALSVSDGAFEVLLDPEQTSKTETVRISDALTVLLGAPGAFTTEIVRIGDTVTARLPVEQTSRTEVITLVEHLAVILTNPLAGLPPPPPIMSTSLVLTIEGVERVFKMGTLEIHESINARNTLRLVVLSSTGLYRPAIHDEIIITKDAVRIFGGTIEDYEEVYLTGDERGDPCLAYSVSAVDFNEIADRRFATRDFPSRILKTSLEEIDDYLVPFGVVLNPSQVDGPVLPAVSFNTVSVAEVLNQLCELTQMLAGPPQAVVWEIDYDKILTVWGVLAIGHTAPFDVAATDANVYGDFRVRPSRTDYANYVILLYGSGDKNLIDTLGTADGTTATFGLHYNMNANEAFVNVGGVIVDDVIVGGTNEPLGLAGSGATWIWNPTTNAVTRTSPPTLGSGLILMPLTAVFPMTATADSGAPLADRRERLYTRNDLFDPNTAAALVNSLLGQASATFKEVSYTTPTPGCHPGQTQTITDANHNISGLHLIIDVKITDRMENVLVYDISAIAGTGTVPESWMDTYRLWFNSGVSGAGGSVSNVSLTPSTAGQAFFLGGNITIRRQSSIPDWVPADAVRVTIDTAVRGSQVGVVRARVLADAGTVTTRLRNITDGTTAGISGAVSGTDWQDVFFSVSLAAGAKVYELQVLPSVANSDVAAVGTFQ
jgi:hypothetical protein